MDFLYQCLCWCLMCEAIFQLVSILICIYTKLSVNIISGFILVLFQLIIRVFPVPISVSQGSGRYVTVVLSMAGWVPCRGAYLWPLLFMFSLECLTALFIRVLFDLFKINIDFNVWQLIMSSSVCMATVYYGQLLHFHKSPMVHQKLFSERNIIVAGGLVLFQNSRSLYSGFCSRAQFPFRIFS